MAAYGPLVLRLALGTVFVAHGAQKVLGVWGGGGLGGTAAFFAAHGLYPAYPLALLVGLVELGGGLLLVTGAYTVITAGALLVDMVVAIWKIHLPHGFFLNWTGTPGIGHGFEFNVVIIGALTCLILSGPGALSIDGRRARAAVSEAAGKSASRPRI